MATTSKLSQVEKEIEKIEAELGKGTSDEEVSNEDVLEPIEPLSRSNLPEMNGYKLSSKIKKAKKVKLENFEDPEACVPVWAREFVAPQKDDSFGGCKLCGVILNSAEQMREHFMGQKHLDKQVRTFWK